MVENKVQRTRLALEKLQTDYTGITPPVILTSLYSSPDPEMEPFFFFFPYSNAALHWLIGITELISTRLLLSILEGCGSVLRVPKVILYFQFLMLDLREDSDLETVIATLSLNIRPFKTVFHLALSN